METVVKMHYINKNTQPTKYFIYIYIYAYTDPGV